MNKKRIISVLSGLGAAFVVIMLAEMAGHAIYPLPDGLDPNTMEDILKYMETAPFGAMLSVIIAWGLGAFAAGLVSTMIAKDGQVRHALICGCILTALCIMNCIMIPCPLWFWVAGVGVSVPLAWIGWRVIR